MSAIVNVLLMGFLIHNAHCEDFSVSLPEQMEALRGSCLTIPCSFTVRDDHEQNLNSECKAKWRDVSNPHQEVKFTRPTTDDLSQKNCTTTVHDLTEQQSPAVYFRLECDNPLKWIFNDKKLNVKVKDAPPTPTLTPPTLSVKEGQSVSVQCSAPVQCSSLPPTLTWSPVLGHIQETLQEQEDKAYVKVSTLNFTASEPKTSLTCFAVYSRDDGTTVTSAVATAQITCSQCPKFNATLPQNIKALEGSCVTIPCSFQVENKYKTHLDSGCKAVWKDASDKTFLSIRQETGNLTDKNCTTTFHDIGFKPNEKHFFRVECNNPLKYTFIEASVNIQVTDAPLTPTLTPPTLSVREGQSVSVQCSAPVPCPSLPPTLTWSPVLGHIQETLLEQQDKTYVKVSTLNFTASHLHHKKNITCSAVYRKEDDSQSHASVRMMPFVTYQPRNTSSSSPDPVTEHSNVTLTCSSDANPAVQHYHWYKADGGTLTRIGNSSVLNMKASRETTAVFCEAQNELGAENSTVTYLTIQYCPRNTSMTDIPPGPVTEDSNITLNCNSDAKPSVFHWYKADGGTHALIGNSSVLNMKASRYTTVIFCEVENHLGTDYSVVTQLDVQFPPQILSSSNCTGDSSQISCVCETEGNPFPLIQWSFPGVSPNISISSEPLSDKALRSVLTVIKPQWKDSVTLVCHSSNSLGSDTQSISAPARHWQDKPRNTRVTVSPPGPVTEHSNVTLTCSSDADPAVQHYHWYKADGGTLTRDRNSAVLNMKVSRETPAVFCEAQNELGTENSTLTELDVQYQPQNTTVTVTPSGPVEEHSNVTLTCHSEANPAVKHYHWYKEDKGTYTLIGTSAVLNITASKDTTSVLCETLTDLGTDRSSLTQLLVKYKPRNTRVTVSPPGPVTEHSNVTLTCSSDADPAVQHYHWYKADGGTLTRDRNSAVLNMKVSRETPAVFCQAQNELGTENSTLTELDVQYQPQNTTVTVTPSGPVEEHCNVTLTCHSEANPAVKHYHWYKEDKGTYTLIGTSAMLNITVSKDTTSVLCETQTDLGTDRSSLTQLLVKYKPRNTRVTVSPPGPVTEHSNVTLTCSSDADPAVQHYHWYKADGGTLTRDRNSAVLNMKVSRETPAVFCQAQNELGTENSTLTELDVQYQPQNTTVTVTPSGPVEEHSNVTLTCHSEANPAVKHYHWYKEDKGTYTLIGTSAVLNITASKDTTSVLCETLTDLGTDRSSLTQLLVKYKPRNTRVTVSPPGPVTEHSNVTLTCSSDADPAVQHYHWYKADGGTLTRDRNSAVLNMKVSRETPAVFCEAQNELGTENSTLTELDVQYQPQNTTVTVTPSGPVEEHSNVTLTCHSEANPAVKHYHWYKEDKGTYTLIGTSAVLNITVSKDTTSVLCETQTDLGTDRSSLTQLLVKYKPRNTRVTVSPPGPVTEHSNVTLTCSSDADPAVQHYHWYKADGGTLTRDRNSAVLNMKVSRETPAVFCQAQNELGTENSTLTELDVQYQPQNTTVTVTPSGPVEEHSNVTLTCHSEANPAVKHYHWYKEDKGTYTLIGTSAVLNITASKDTTSVLCETQTDLGTDRSSLTQLLVKYKPRNTRVTVSPPGPVTEHSNVTLTCSSDADPAVQHYHWYKADGGTLTRDRNSAVLNMKVSRETPAVFCQAQNELGTENSTLTELDVQFPPQILSSSNCTGDSSQISCVCETEGNPFPLIQWSFPGVSPNISISSEPLSDKALRSVLTVIKPQWKDSVTLVCHSSNSLGSHKEQLHAQSFQQSFQQSGVGSAVTLPLLVTIIFILLALMGALLYVIRTQNVRLNKRQSFVALNQMPPSNERFSETE
ncbi:sialoadhesin-like [Eucyclogobius newberryi]|uniref:sialoadhesin-like n=1 Tax=Eucyclogobius newberryi TaxID=166745 RepID=UPI003B5C52B5